MLGRSPQGVASGFAAPTPEDAEVNRLRDARAHRPSVTAGRPVGHAPDPAQCLTIKGWIGALDDARGALIGRAIGPDDHGHDHPTLDAAIRLDRWVRRLGSAPQTGALGDLCRVVDGGISARELCT